MDTKKHINPLPLLYSVCLSLLLLSFLSFSGFAETLPVLGSAEDNFEEHEQVRNVQELTVLDGQSIGHSEQQEQEYAQEIQMPIALPEDSTNPTDFEILLTLKSIEYQLKIIAGGMVLALISLFIWFTILKPIKGFTRF